MSHEELIRRDKLLVEFRTDISVSKTSSDLIPTLGINNMVSQPGREAIKSVLSVGSARDRVGTIRSSDNKGEDEDKEEETYEDGHTTEVKSQKCLFVPIGTKETTERHN